MYCYPTTIRLHQTDAAGVVFFSNLFVIAHDAYECFLESHIPLHTILLEETYILPIVHAEADYLLPLTLSDSIAIELSLGHMGSSSFDLNYVIKNRDKQIAAHVKTIHAVRKKDGSQKTTVPAALKNLLETL